MGTRIDADRRAGQLDALDNSTRWTTRCAGQLDALGNSMRWATESRGCTSPAKRYIERPAGREQRHPPEPTEIWCVRFLIAPPDRSTLASESREGRRSRNLPGCWCSVAPKGPGLSGGRSPELPTRLAEVQTIRPKVPSPWPWHRDLLQIHRQAVAETACRRRLFRGKRSGSEIDTTKSPTVDALKRSWRRPRRRPKRAIP